VGTHKKGWVHRKGPSFTCPAKRGRKPKRKWGGTPLTKTAGKPHGTGQAGGRPCPKRVVERKKSPTKLAQTTKKKKQQLKDRPVGGKGGWVKHPKKVGEITPSDGGGPTPIGTSQEGGGVHVKTVTKKNRVLTLKRNNSRPAKNPQTGVGNHKNKKQTRRLFWGLIATPKQTKSKKDH